MTTLLKELHTLLAPTLRKRLYLAMSYPTAPPDTMIALFPEHLRYMKQFESEIFLSGPFIKDGQLVGEFMTILRTDSEVRAAEFMRNEPFVRHGLRRFDLKLWEMREGSLTMTAKLSESSVDIR